MRIANLFAPDSGLSTTPPTKCDSCAGGQTTTAANCEPGTLPSGMMIGALPVVSAYCPGDTVLQYGRINAIWVPDYVFWGHFARAADFASVAPRSDSGTKPAGALTLTMGVDAGIKVLVPGIIFDVMTSNNVAPGITQFSIAGVFEDNTLWTQDITVSAGHQGLSRFAIIATREVQGGAYPSLCQIMDNFVITSTGLFLGPTAVTSLTVTVNRANVDTDFYTETLSPVSELWYWVMAKWYNSARKAA